MSQELLAAIGAKQIELENTRSAWVLLNSEYDTLLLLLSKVVSGEILSEQVTVDLVGRSWAHMPIPPVEAQAAVDEPAQVPE